jgi:hypothetical protein
MRYEGLADYYGLMGLKKYVAEREWWSPPDLPKDASAEASPRSRLNSSLS